MSRDEALAQAKRSGIELPAEAKTDSIDENLWGRPAGAGPLEDPWNGPAARELRPAGRRAGDRRCPAAVLQGVVHGDGAAQPERALRPVARHVRSEGRQVRPPAGRGVRHAVVAADPRVGRTRARRPGTVTTVWGGRFAGPPGEDANAFTRDRTDRRLLVPDLIATRVHAAALHRAGLLDEAELAQLRGAIDELLQGAERAEFPFEDGDEDVHVAVERLLTERLGPPGARIHAGRSRNDPVATDLRLWVQHAALDVAGRVRGLAAALADRAEQRAEATMPGYTHP